MLGRGKRSIYILVSCILSIILLTGCKSNTELLLSGTVESNEIDVTSEAAGKVISFTKEEGAAVKQGEVIAKIDDEFQKLVVQQYEAVAEMKKLQVENASTENTADILKQDYSQAKAALKQQKLLLQKHQIISPIDGIFTSKNVEIGDLVNKGSSMGVISDVKDLTVTVYIPQKYLNLISLNQNVKLLFSSLDQTDVTGEIRYISSEAQFTPKNTETKEAKENTVFKVKIKVLDHIEKIKPGMTVDVVIPMEAK